MTWRGKMERKLVKGKTIEEQISSIDVILKRLRLPKPTNKVGLISPIPISAFTDEPDVPLRFMFAGKGKISDLYIYIDSPPKSGIVIDTAIYSGLDKMARSVTIKKPSTMTTLDFITNAKDRVEIKFENVVKEEPKPKSIWIAFLWIPDISIIGVQKLADEVVAAEAITTMAPTTEVTIS
jgi:hypothetical protein